MFEEFTHILTDPAHMLAELTSHIIIEFVLLGFAFPIIQRLVRRHDRIHHGVDHE